MLNEVNPLLFNDSMKLIGSTATVLKLATLQLYYLLETLM